MTAKETLNDNLLSKVATSILHNEEKRITIVCRDKFAFTFQLPEEDNEIDDEAQIVFEIQKDDARIAPQHFGKDLYVLTDLRAYDDEEDMRSGNSYAQASLTLYKVSAPELISKSQDMTYLMGSIQFECYFQLNQSFARARRAERHCMVETAVPIITADKEILGAMFFEKPKTGEVTLNWFESWLTHKRPKLEEHYFP